MPTVVAAWTKVIVDYAAQNGVDVTRADVDLSHRDLRVPAHLDDAIWQAADHALGDDDLGIHLAERGVSAASFGVAGSSCVRARRWARRWPARSSSIA